MTIHKGLGIKVAQKIGQGKGMREIGMSKDNSSLIVSIQNKIKLREDWKHVDIVFLDEISLVSAQLLAEIDHALRFAKENNTEWFGGASAVFSGDFYQFPPVSGTPLSSPILESASQTNNELLKRIGRLAWKTVDTVIELTEQERMKGDKEYGDAVQRLHTRNCIPSDVDLFNSRLIKSLNNPSGQNMGQSGNIHAPAIVNTNRVREILNFKKATAMGDNNVILCASRDVISPPIPITNTIYESLLKQDFSSSSNQGALPGYLPLYESMPVMLRLKNLSTELKITNGSCGIVRKIFTKLDKYNNNYCECAIVEFEGSPVQIEGLPQSYFPVFPITFSYSKILNSAETGKDEVVHICRHQLPIQPAFAVTGHSAQGKTLPKVLAFLNEGGFGAYVAASRACKREDLCVVYPVSLSDLNKPLPSDLFYEMKCLQALEYNTAINFQFSNNQLKTIPDIDHCANHQSLLLPNFVESSENAPKSKK